MQQFPLKFVIGTAGIIIASGVIVRHMDGQNPPIDPVRPDTSGTSFEPICDFKESLISPGTSNIDGDWRLEWSGGGYIHEAILKMQGKSGEMLVRSPDLNNGGQRLVYQTMRLYNSSKGLVLLGSNPVDPGTQNRSQDYAADNFLIRVKNNKLTITNCDDAGNTSPVSIEEL